MAGVLHTFEPNTKILSSQVNENFETVQGDLTELSTNLEEYLSQENTKVKEELLEDIETTKDEIIESVADLTLSNVTITTDFLNKFMPDYSARISIGSGYITSQPGLVHAMASADRSAYVTINGYSFQISYDTGDGQSAGSGQFLAAAYCTITFSNVASAYFIPITSADTEND